MPPKKRPGKDFLVEGSSYEIGGQVLKTIQPTTQLETSTEPRPAMAKTRRPREPLKQRTTQAEAPPINTSAPSTQPPLQHQETETLEDQ
jgi:hypothetical protein